MPLQIIKHDITKLKVDAIVNAANTPLLGGGGVDGCIHHAAGPLLLEECKKLGGCAVGESKITGGYNLPSKYVIHTVGPIYHDGTHNEKTLLQSCYRTSLNLAAEYKCESVAFPLISAGVYGYPKAEALDIAVGEIAEFLTDNDMSVYIVIYDKDSFKIDEILYSDINEFINRNYTALNSPRVFNRQICFDKGIPDQDEYTIRMSCEPLVEDGVSLDEFLNTIDESFSQMLLRKIDEKGMKDSECYKKANIDRKLFSKIRSNPAYAPSKPTAIAFAIALELNLEETKDMLMKAGFSLSHSNKFDLIIEYFISNKNYNIFEINESLFAFDQHLLGA